jgi:hypothetical protein
MNGSTGKAVVEQDAPEVIDDGPNVGPMMMTKVDPAAELAKFEAAAQLLSKLVPASIRATKPQDWVKMGAKVYLQATGIERLAPLWGLAFGEPKIAREEYEGGEFGYAVSGWVRSRFGLMHVVGGRSSNDPFFDSFDEEKPSGWAEMDLQARLAWKAQHRVKPDPMDVRKAAVTNWMTRGGSMACGLRGLTPADLEANGIRGVAQVEFGKGGKGGDTAPADIKAKRTALWNDILKRTGGDLEAARNLLQDVTKYGAYTNKATGKEVPAGTGYTDHEKMTNEKAIDIAASKLKKHPMFGDEAAGQRESGQEG